VYEEGGLQNEKRFESKATAAPAEGRVIWVDRLTVGAGSTKKRGSRAPDDVKKRKETRKRSEEIQAGRSPLRKQWWRYGLKRRTNKRDWTIIDGK